MPRRAKRRGRPSAISRVSTADLMREIERRRGMLGRLHATRDDLTRQLEAINADLGVFAEVRGRGLMLGAVLEPAYVGRAGEILDHAAGNGLLLLQAGPDVLRFVPALNVGDDDIAEGLARLRAALQAFVAG